MERNRAPLAAQAWRAIITRIHNYPLSTLGPILPAVNIDSNGKIPTQGPSCTSTMHNDFREGDEIKAVHYPRHNRGAATVDSGSPAAAVGNGQPCCQRAPFCARVRWRCLPWTQRVLLLKLLRRDLPGTRWSCAKVPSMAAWKRWRPCRWKPSPVSSPITKGWLPHDAAPAAEAAGGEAAPAPKKKAAKKKTAAEAAE